MSFSVCDKDLCVGCGACADACPGEAITLSQDSYGFLRPVIDGSKCVVCRTCRGVCPANGSHKGGASGVFAAYAKDKNVRNKSSSGGIFRLLADKTLEDGGVVAAVGYDENFRVVYKVASSGAKLDEMMGSKYTEALPNDIYSKVRDVLDSGKKVLFVGTPCRVAALKNLTGDRENLLTVDFLCHGVPSGLLFEKFIDENFKKRDITDVSFRDKTHGWQEFSMRVDLSVGKPYVCSQYKDPYLRMFLGNRFLRESCYNCKFKRDGYVSDVTLGDFWGISSCIPSMNDDKGTSAVVVRTEKGSAAFDGIKDRIVYRETTESTLGKANAALNNSSKKPEGRDAALEMLKNGNSFSDIAGKYGRPASAKAVLTERAKRGVKVMLGKIKK